MPFPLQALILWLHLLAAMTWIGAWRFKCWWCFRRWHGPSPQVRLRFALSLEALSRDPVASGRPNPVYRVGESHEHLVCHRRDSREHLAHVYLS